MLQVTRTNPFTGRVNTRMIDCTEEQYAAWESGVLAQHAFPQLDADDREFIISGLTAEDLGRAVRRVAAYSTAHTVRCACPKTLAHCPAVCYSTHTSSATAASSTNRSTHNGYC